MKAGSALERDLKALVGDRATTSRFERWFYARDIVHIPRGIRAMLKPMPDAVVRPANTGQVSAVVRYCHQQGIPVVPRGAGSSGLFQAVPKRGGVVLDLLDLNLVEQVEIEGLAVTAGAGTTWWRLENRLNRQGLTLKSYPSSARSATLAGWLMTSGIGIGSLKYGPVFDHVVSAEIVLPDGSVREYRRGEGLDPFFESEGMLGVLTRVKLQVRKVPPSVAHRLTYFAGIRDLFAVLNMLADMKPRPYNAEFQDHRYLALLRQADYPLAEFGNGSGVLLATFDGPDVEVRRGVGGFEDICLQHGGRQVGGAQEEWEQRFNIMRIKRAVPGLVPSSAYLPIGKVADFYSGLEKLKKRPFGLVGYLVSQDRVSLMPLIATDESRPVEYLFAMQTPASVSRVATRLGGRPGGGVGVWNAAYRNLLGKERLEEVRKAKRSLDPQNMMNPGMWPEPPLLFRPAVYRVATGIASRLDRFLPSRAAKSQGEGFAAELQSCVQCGYCMDVCPTAQGWMSSTPRGRILSTRELFLGHADGQGLAPEYLERMYQCTLCGRCGVDCCVDIRSRPMWQGARRYLTERGLFPESLRELTTSIAKTHNMAGKPNDQRANWVSRLNLPFDLREKRSAEVVYFVGCVTSFFPMAQPAARAFCSIMEAAGLDFGVVGGNEWCCGFPLMSAGISDAAAECVHHNMQHIRDMGAKTLVMTCPGCYRVWKEEYREVTGERHPFEVLHAAELLARLAEEGRLPAGDLEGRLTYHDPCDLGRNSGIYDEPRYLLERIPGIELRELAEAREYCSCCGSGGDLLASNQELSLEIAGRKLEEILATGADTVVTACPSCVRAIGMARTAARAKIGVMDITELVWKAAGK